MSRESLIGESEWSALCSVVTVASAGARPLAGQAGGTADPSGVCLGEPLQCVRMVGDTPRRQ